MCYNFMMIVFDEEGIRMKVIPGDKVIYTFKHDMDYVDKVSVGERFKVVTNDCWFQQIKSENQAIEQIDFNVVNPATGPIYVEGAEPGDVLKVKIIDIAVADYGSAAVIPNEGLLGDKVTKPVVKIIRVEEDYAIFNGMKLSIDPMIGVIGVAPALEDGEWPTGSPWHHGGNMDTTDIKIGSTLYFPVNQRGALLALGDCHARMGDGEVCVTGLEIRAEVTLEVDVIKHKSITWPIVETDEYIMVISSGDSLEKASYESTNQVVEYLKNGLKMSWEDAYMLASLVVDLKISQLVDPKVTVRAAIPKYVLPINKLMEAL